MTPTHVVLSLGMSRSGTTFFERMMETGKGYFAQKLGESRPQHPLKGDGLFDYVTTFRRRAVVVVHQRRDPDDTWAAWLAIKKIRAPKPFLPDWDRAEFDRRNALQIARFDEFAARTRELHPMGVNCHALVLHYEQLGRDSDRKSFLTTLAGHLPHSGANLDAWLQFCTKRWMKRPVTDGRLKTRLAGR